MVAPSSAASRANRSFHELDNNVRSSRRTALWRERGEQGARELKHVFADAAALAQGRPIVDQDSQGLPRMVRAALCKSFRLSILL